MMSILFPLVLVGVAPTNAPVLTEYPASERSWVIGEGRGACDSVPEGHPFEGLETRSRPWPGRQSAEERSAVQATVDALVSAMNTGDSSAILAHRTRLEFALGRYVGEPEDRPFYGQPVDVSTPDLHLIKNLWSDQHLRSNGLYPWDIAALTTPSRGAPDRLRVATRIARAHLHVYESNELEHDDYLHEAVAAAEYLLTVQAANGVFGYPYDANATIGLRGVAARFVHEARQRGFEVTEGNWIIDDLQSGDLNFDNAQAGLFLLHAYVQTGDARYLESARRAGEWAMRRPLVANYNYNGFNGQLLSRLYRVTGEEHYLDRARLVFEHGVLSGQLQNGRWFDQHNAKIQYHSILMSQLVEFYLALQLAQDPFSTTVESAIVRGLDNLATEITTYGSSNTQEMLAVDALVFGSRALGQRELWTRAINVDVNFLVDRFRPRISALGQRLPDPLGTYILFASEASSAPTGIDSVVGPIMLATPRQGN